MVPCGLGYLARPLGPGVEDLVQLPRVVQQRVRLLPDGGEALDEDLGEVLFEVAVPLALVRGLDLRDRTPGHGGVDVEEVGDGRLVGGGQDLGPRVGLGATDLTPDN